MGKFTYRAVNDKGRPVRGTISAANQTALASMLEGSGMVLVDCKELSEKNSKFKAILIKKVKVRDMIQMFVHLEQLQKAGVPLMESLADIRDTTESERLRDIMSDVYREVSEGTSFSDALKKHPTTFKTVFISLINAGEETRRC